MFTNHRWKRAKEPLNKSAAAVSGSFAPTYWFENLEIRKGFLRFPNLNLETKFLADRSCNLSVSENYFDIFKLHKRPRNDTIEEKQWGYRYGSKTV